MKNNTNIKKRSAFEYVRIKHVINKSDLQNVDKGFFTF